MNWFVYLILTNRGQEHVNFTARNSSIRFELSSVKKEARRENFFLRDAFVGKVFEVGETDQQMILNTYAPSRICSTNSRNIWTCWMRDWMTKMKLLLC